MYAELGVPIRMALPLRGLAVGLEAVVELLEQAADRVVADPVAACDQLLGQMAGALGGPEQGRFRVASGDGLEEAPEVVEPFRVAPREPRPPGTRPADPLGRGFGRGSVEVGDPGSDGRARHACGFGDGRGATPAQGPSLGSGPTAEDPLVHDGGERLILLVEDGEDFLRDHTQSPRANTVPKLTN